MDKDKLIALVRKDTGIRLDVDDPVLAVAALHEAMLSVALERVEMVAQQAAAQMAGSATQAVATAQREAGRIVTETAEWVSERLREAGAEVAATLVQETQAEAARAEAAHRGAVRAAWVAGGVSLTGAVTVCAVALAVLWR